MTSIGSGVNYALLYGGSGTADLFSTILNGASATGASSADPLTALKLATKNKTKGIADEAKDATVVRDVAAFKKGIAGAKTIQAALSNPAVLKVLLTANGLGDQVAFTGLAQKALLSDPTDPTSLASKLSSTNSAWLSTAKAYNFAKNGLSVLQSPTVQSTLANGYAEIKWQQSLDQQTPGLSNAMLFQSQAATITNVDQILGDAVNRDVVLTALNIPMQIAYQTLGAQEKAVSSRLDVTKLKDAHFVQALTQRYLLSKAQDAATAGTDLTSLAAGSGILA